MTRINTNLSSITGQHALARSNKALETSLVRLSTGYRINSGKDDPAGLIASEVLRSEIASIAQSIKNSERANNIIATADAALAEVSTLLNDIRTLVQASANKGAISASEIAANQVQVDSALETITRIAQTTVFGGEKLLNGTKSFSVNATGGSLGVFQSTADIAIKSFDPALHSLSQGDDVAITITQAATKKKLEVIGDDYNVGNGAGLLDLSLGSSTRTTSTLVVNDFAIGNGASLNDLSTNSTRATRTITGNGGGGAGLEDLTGTGAQTVTLTITGELGAVAGVVVNVADLQADSQVLVDAINAVSDETGVVATTAGGAGADITLTSTFVGAAVTAINVQATAASVGGDVTAFNNAVGALSDGTTGAAKSTTFTVTGSKGTANITLANNDTVINDGASTLVDLINTRTGTTGVTASLDGSGNIVLTSSGVGSASLANIAVATGGDAGDIALLSAAGTKTTVAGTDGTSNTSTFELIGDEGRAVVTISNDAVINDVAALVSAINAVSTQTGITASGSGHGGLVTLTSKKYGSNAVLTLNAIGATNSADIALLNSANTQVATNGVNSAGTASHANGSGALQGNGEVVSYNDSSLSLTATTDPSLAPATRATTTVQGNTAGAGGLDSLTGTGSQTISFTVTGALGSVAISNVNVAALKADSRLLVDLINAQTLNTGVRASTDGTALADIVLTSTVDGAAGSASIVATAASVAGDVTAFNNADTFTGTVAGANASVLSTFDVTGGALFQIGPTVNFANQVNVNVTSLDLSTLGRNFTTTGNKGLSAIKTGGTDTLDNADLTTAAMIVEQAISQVATLRGELGALQKNVLESNIRSLQTTFEQVTAAESVIRDADFAVETATLTRSQILVQAGTNVLAIANQSPQNVLALLGR